MADNGAGAGIRWDKEVDWLVVGGGGAGMVSALTANHLGLDTLVIEKAPYMGGSTARSGGVVWIPNNYLVREGGLPDSEERARSYMASTVGNRVPSEVQESFVKYGPQMIEFLRDHTETRFVWSKGYSDYYPEATGGF
ncbi:MAG: 3-ketosteroid-delta-1-dehydrogenase, partial [Alphaproteobacteria bacterium HGW-Alphaproteobacteria-12]